MRSTDEVFETYWANSAWKRRSVIAPLHARQFGMTPEFLQMLELEEKWRIKEAWLNGVSFGHVQAENGVEP
jgi:hypothetical protein